MRDWNEVGENGWYALEELEGEGEGKTRYLELRKGGIDKCDDMMEDTVESVGESIEDMSEH